MSGSFAMVPPTVLDMIERPPSGWAEVEPGPVVHALGVTDAKAWKSSTLLVIVTVEDLGNGGLWLHSSCSGPTSRPRGARRQPTWDELALVKEVIHGDRLVVQVLPPRSSYMNLAECLHLWERIDGTPTIPESVWRVR